MSRVITMLKTNQLYHHPNNPREVYENLDELAASIRMNGIWQNLIVVPYSPVDHGSLTPADPDNSFVVVMGNRRLEASDLAELEELPCVIDDMPLNEQIMAMHQENNLREAACPYKEAQNFQMLLDMGETVDTLAEKSGLSTTTIRNRVKLLVLQKDKFDAAQERGAKLTDYLELDKVKDPALKNKVLDAIGTKNFARVLDTAMTTEKHREYINGCLSTLNTFATKLDSAEAVSGIRLLSTHAWWMAAQVTVPDDLDTYKYYFVQKDEGENAELRLYTDKPAPEVVIDQAQIKRKEAQAKREAKAKELSNSTYKLRFNFIKEVSFAKAKKHLGIIAEFFAGAMRNRDDATVYYEQTPWRINYETLAELLDIGYEKATNTIDEKALNLAFTTQPAYAMLCMAYVMWDKPSKSYINASHWNVDKQVYETVYNACDALDTVYSLLEKLGYEMSDEEIQLQNGNHNIFTEDEEPAEKPVVEDAPAETVVEKANTEEPAAEEVPSEAGPDEAAETAPVMEQNNNESAEADPAA